MMKSSLRGASLLIPFFCLVGCSLFYAADVDGHRPDDVVRLFIEAVRADDIKKASLYWKSGDISNIESNWKMTFDEFCRSKIDCDTYSIEIGGTDKGLVIVYYQGMQGGKKKTLSFFVDKIDGRWKLRMDSIFRD